MPQSEAFDQAGKDRKASEVDPVSASEVELLSKKAQDNCGPHEDMISDHCDAVGPQRFVHGFIWSMMYINLSQIALEVVKFFVAEFFPEPPACGYTNVTPGPEGQSAATLTLQRRGDTNVTPGPEGQCAATLTLRLAGGRTFSYSINIRLLRDAAP